MTAFATRLFEHTDLPQHLQIFFTKASLNSDSTAARNTVLPWRTRFSLWSFSVLMGILSHVGFDLVSHDTNLLLYPWYENVRWFPGWWYTTWFEIRPLPTFGHSYSVGLFTVIWCILTLLGIFLFFQFFSSKHENRVWTFSHERHWVVGCPAWFDFEYSMNFRIVRNHATLLGSHFHKYIIWHGCQQENRKGELLWGAS